MATNKSGEKIITDEYEKILKHNDLSFYKYKIQLDTITLISIKSVIIKIFRRLTRL